MTTAFRSLLGLFALLVAIHSSSAAEGGKLKTYQLVFFRPGTNTNVSPAEAGKMQAGHLANLKKLNADRVNVLYGPFLDKGDLRGLAVLDVPDADAARKTLADDPYVKSGHMTLEVKPWMSEAYVFSVPDSPEVPDNLVFGFLMRGTNQTQLPKEESERIQSGHLEYMLGLHKQGKLLAAGPFAENSDWRGVVVYRVANVEAAQELAANDPAVKIGRLRLDAHPWMTFKGMLKGPPQAN